MAGRARPAGWLRYQIIRAAYVLSPAVVGTAFMLWISADRTTLQHEMEKSGLLSPEKVEEARLRQTDEMRRLRETCMEQAGCCRLPSHRYPTGEGGEHTCLCEYCYPSRAVEGTQPASGIVIASESQKVVSCSEAVDVGTLLAAGPMCTSCKASVHARSHAAATQYLLRNVGLAMAESYTATNMHGNDELAI
eukprot:jgi/Mesvir1/2379/Mv24185-RA.1